MQCEVNENYQSTFFYIYGSNTDLILVLFCLFKKCIHDLFSSNEASQKRILEHTST